MKTQGTSVGGEEISNETMLAEIYEEMAERLYCYEFDSDFDHKPVMIGDCLEYFQEINGVIEFLQIACGLMREWKLKRLPIGSQSQECIEYVHSLLSKK